VNECCFLVVKNNTCNAITTEHQFKKKEEKKRTASFKVTSDIENESSFFSHSVFLSLLNAIINIRLEE
jgi:hypothetical protein